MGWLGYDKRGDIEGLDNGDERHTAGWREAGLLIARDGRVLHRHAPDNRTAVSLPDSRSLWDAIWEHRTEVAGFAHSHPGSGPPSPSREDLTTFAAVEAALGQRLEWPIASVDQWALVWWCGPGRLDYDVIQMAPWAPAGQSWLLELREMSR